MWDFSFVLLPHHRICMYLNIEQMLNIVSLLPENKHWTLFHCFQRTNTERCFVASREQMLNIALLLPENKCWTLFKCFKRTNVKHYSYAFREELPGKWNEDLDDFQKLIVLKCLRADKVTNGMQDYVSEHLGQRFIEPQVRCFKCKKAILLFTSKYCFCIIKWMKSDQHHAGL